MISRTSMRVAQVVVVVAVLVFVGIDLAGQWTSIAALQVPAIDWPLMLASAAIVAMMYAVLIWTWQRTVLAWGERLSFRAGARIWFVSNLGRFVPGRVWQVASMGIMAQRAGVSPVAAVGSSIVVNLVNVPTGLAIAVACGAGTADAPGWAIPAAVAFAIGAIGMPWLLPVAGRVASVVLRREVTVPRLPHSAVWIAVAGTSVGWALYGVAFRLLHIALLGHATGDLMRSTAAFTASYLAGYLFLPTPGGLGVREDALQRLLVSFAIAPAAQAWMIVIVSRIWLTILEVLPGLVLLLIARRTRTEPSTTQPA